MMSPNPRVAQILHGAVTSTPDAIVRSMIEAALSRPAVFLALFGTALEHAEFRNSDAPNSDSWTAHARDGRKIEAIKDYRNLYAVGLKEGKDAVEAYCRCHNIF